MLRSQTQGQSPLTVGTSLHLKHRNTATIAAPNLVSSHTMVGTNFFSSSLEPFARNAHRTDQTFGISELEVDSE